MQARVEPVEGLALEQLFETDDSVPVEAQCRSNVAELLLFSLCACIKNHLDGLVNENFPQSNPVESLVCPRKTSCPSQLCGGNTDLEALLCSRG